MEFHEQRKALDHLRAAVEGCLDAEIAAAEIRPTFERLLIAAMIVRQPKRAGAVSRTAAELGIHRNSLSRKMQQLGMCAVKPGQQKRTRIA